MRWIITALHQALGAFVARQARARQVVWLGTACFVAAAPAGRLPELPDAVWGLFYQRLSRLRTRFQTLFDRWRTNTLPPRRESTRTARRSASPGTTPALRLPRAHGWVNHRIPESAPPTGQLDALLHDPEMRDFVAAAPQAGRLLRPLCRALGVPLPDWLKLPKRPRARPAPPPDPAPAPSFPTRPPTPDRPLPAYVRAAVRAWRKKSR